MNNKQTTLRVLKTESPNFFILIVRNDSHIIHLKKNFLYHIYTIYTYMNARLMKNRYETRQLAKRTYSHSAHVSAYRKN